MTSEADADYLEALKEISAQSRSSIAVCAMPLGILLTQLRYLAGADSLVISVLSTIAILTLFAGVCISWHLATVIQSTLAVETLTRGQPRDGKGAAYLGYMSEHFAGGAHPYTEDGIIRASRPLMRPYAIFTIVGYFALLFLLMAVIWGGSVHDAAT